MLALHVSIAKEDEVDTCNVFYDVSCPLNDGTALNVIDKTSNIFVPARRSRNWSTALWTTIYLSCFFKKYYYYYYYTENCGEVYIHRIQRNSFEAGNPRILPMYNNENKSSKHAWINCAHLVQFLACMYLIASLLMLRSV